MEKESKCPKCSSENIYDDGNSWVCPECSNEWVPGSPALIAENSESQDSESQDIVIRDANGNTLKSGDSVTVIKELRVKGSSSIVKVGTKVKNIRLMNAGDGHDIACKIEGVGAINLKSEFVKKA